MYMDSLDLLETWNIELQCSVSCPESPAPRVSRQPQSHWMHWRVSMPWRRTSRHLTDASPSPIQAQLETQLQAAAGRAPVNHHWKMLKRKALLKVLPSFSPLFLSLPWAWDPRTQNQSPPVVSNACPPPPPPGPQLFLVGLPGLGWVTSLPCCWGRVAGHAQEWLGDKACLRLQGFSRLPWMGAAWIINSCVQ